MFKFTNLHNIFQTCDSNVIKCRCCTFMESIPVAILSIIYGKSDKYYFYTPISTFFCDMNPWNPKCRTETCHLIWMCVYISPPPPPTLFLKVQLPPVDSILIRSKQAKTNKIWYQVHSQLRSRSLVRSPWRQHTTHRRQECTRWRDQWHTRPVHIWKRK